MARGKHITVDLRQLRYFVVLAGQQHFGKAASILHIAQPALTRQIHLLEEELGVQLFERHPRGATPTPEAGLLFERASFILRYAEQLRHDMAATQRDAVGPIALGMSPGLARVLAAPLSKILSQRYPGVRLQLIEEFADQLRAQLVEGTIDLAILNGPSDRPHFITTPLLREAMCLIGLAGNPHLSRQRTKVKQLAGVPLILTGVSKSGVRLKLEAAAAREKIELNVRVEVQSIDVAKRLIVQDDACTVHFAAPLQPDILAGTIRAVPIDGLDMVRFFARLSDRPPSRATVVVSELIQEIVASMVALNEWPNATIMSVPARKKPDRMVR
jgi:LysR family nitrogen assimilation transcriptional regulator